jgi:ankyrin repeat protein
LHELLRRGANVNEGTTSHDEIRNSAPLHYSALESNLDGVWALVRNGADIHCVNALGESVIYWAAGNATADGVKILEYLEGLGCDLNSRTTYGATPLHLAAYLGIMGNVEFLLDHGADKDAFATKHHYNIMIDMKGTPENYARKEGHWLVAHKIATWGED